MKKILVVTLLILLNACGPIYRSNLEELKQTAKQEDFGNPPPKNYKEIGENAIKEYMRDPDSAQFKDWTEPHTCLFPSRNSMTIPELGWCNSVKVNGKNGFGGYIGYELYHIVWKNNYIYYWYKDGEEYLKHYTK